MIEYSGTAAGLYAGLEAGGTKFNCVVGTDPQNIIARTKIPTTRPEETLPAVRDFYRQQAEFHGPLKAMGIACFGPVDMQKSSATWGYITATPKPYWSDTEVAGYFARELEVPVAFDTDVNGSALGEFGYGAARGIDDFVYVTIGTGIGAGVFANGRPLNGLIHTELGHQLVARADDDLDSFQGTCPFHTDCLTDLACGPAIEARWKCKGHELGEDHPAWDLQAHYLAVMCVNIAMAYSPRLIILGGGVMDQKHLFAKVRGRFTDLMNGFMMPSIPMESYIVPPALPGHSGEVGSIALALQAVDQ